MKRLLLSMSVIALLALSCAQPDDSPVFTANPDAVAFSAAIRPSTRATDISFESGDKISIFATDNGSLQYSNYADNVEYTYYDGLFTTQESLTYADMNTTLAFYAVYPYDEYTTPGFTFYVNLDQSTHDAYTKSDLMTASNTGRDQEVVDLVFNHNLTKVVLNFSSNNLPAGIQYVTFKNVYYAAEANLSSNTFKATGYRSDIEASPNGTNSFKVILPPQTIQAGELFAEIVIGGKTYVWEVERDLILSSGVEYVYDLELQDNSVMFTSQINPWNEPSDIEAVIPDEYIDLMDDYIPIYDGTTPPDIEGIWLMDPLELYYDSAGATKEDFDFAPDYIWFYDQTSDNTLNMMSTQNLGDLSTAEGVFVSGSGNNFTVYFNEYVTYNDGSWLVKATLMSGTVSGSYIKNFRYAFIIVEDYDPNSQFMDAGDFRVLEDGDYWSEQTAWPLNTKNAGVSGDLITIKK